MIERLRTSVEQVESNKFSIDRIYHCWTFDLFFSVDERNDHLCVSTDGLCKLKIFIGNKVLY